MDLEIIKGDITKLKVDVIVNAANSTLYGGGGVDGAIHAAAGPGLLDECKEIRKNQYPDGLPTGQAVLTTGYDLPAKYVIHTVGPIYNKDPNPAKLLEDAYRNSLRLAEEKGLESIAFPAISTGVYGYPKKEALHIVKDVMDTFKFKNIKTVTLCYFSDEAEEQARWIFGFICCYPGGGCK